MPLRARPIATTSRRAPAIAAAVAATLALGWGQELVAMGRAGPEQLVRLRDGVESPRHRDHDRQRAKTRARAKRRPTTTPKAKGEPLPLPPAPSAAAVPVQARDQAADEVAPTPAARSAPRGAQPLADEPQGAPRAEAPPSEPDDPRVGASMLRGGPPTPPTLVRNPDAMPNPNLAPRPAPLPGLLPDHSLEHIDDVATLSRLCSVDGGPLACKLTITGLGRDPGTPHFYDPRFYAYHDEWMWMHQLAGHALVDGPPPLPGGRGFATVADAYRAVAAMAVMPIGLSWTHGRLYSDGFYDIAARQGTRQRPRRWMAATLRHLPAEPRRRRPEPLWLVELEETDAPSEAELAQLHAALAAHLPAEVGAALRWLVRPTAGQEALAARIDAGRHAFTGRVVRYDELIVPGRATPYTQGVAAGRLRLIRRGEDAMGVAGPHDIVLLEQLPDALPPVAGIVTLHEQAAQAHVNLLAAARGTPNAAAPDLVSDPTTRALAQRDAPVALLVTERGVQLKALLPEQWARWQQRSGSLPPALMPYDPRGDAYLYDLGPATKPGTGDATGADADKAVIAGFAGHAGPSTGLVGGKAYGLWHLLRSLQGQPVAAPPRPLVLSTRCYVETLAPLEGAIFDVINDAQVLNDRRVRILALQGQKGFDAWHQPGTQAHQDAQRWLAAFRQLPMSPALRVAIASGGLQEMVRRQPLSAGCQAKALPAIAAHARDLAPSQGLRFRSSSSVEDLPGFNGAGLYRSVTGWVEPNAAGPAKGDKARRSMAAAISEVFASYWSFEAFEEREAAAIWHLDGTMAVVIHPRFDDDKELANGVVLARVRDQAGAPPLVVVEVNAQAGATSVTNARGEAGGRPYVVRLRRQGDAPFAIERRSAADVPRPEALDDSTLLALASAAEAAARDQLGRERRVVGPSQQPLSTVADLEFRLVAAGWPARRDGAVLPGRLVLKQLRPLSRPPRVDVDALDQALRGHEGVPSDVLPYIERVVRRSCVGGGLQVHAVLVDLDAGAPMRETDELGLLAAVQVRGRFGKLRLAHVGHARDHAMRRRGTELAVELPQPGASGDVARLTVAADGAFTLALPGAADVGGRMRCNDRVLAQTETAWLRSLFDP